MKQYDSTVPIETPALNNSCRWLLLAMLLLLLLPINCGKR
jgi:hypothetical protein